MCSSDKERERERERVDAQNMDEITGSSAGAVMFPARGISRRTTLNRVLSKEDPECASHILTKKKNQIHTQTHKIKIEGEK